MKKLNKIKLSDFAILNENEMKMVVGGSGTGTGSCGSEYDVCEGKGGGDPCYVGPECKRGYCKQITAGQMQCIGYMG